MDPTITLLIKQFQEIDGGNSEFYDLLLKTNHTIEDLRAIREYTGKLIPELQDPLEEIALEVVGFAPVNIFVEEIQKIVNEEVIRGTPGVKLRNCLRSISKFLSSSTSEFNGDLIADLIMLVPEIQDERVQQFCLILLDKLNSLIDSEISDE